MSLAPHPGAGASEQIGVRHEQHNLSRVRGDRPSCHPLRAGHRAAQVLGARARPHRAEYGRARSSLRLDQESVETLGVEPPRDTYGQMHRALEIVLEALAGAGARPSDVVRTRTFLTPAADSREAGRAHGEVFGEIRPASTMLVVTALLDPRWMVEVEAEALLDA